MACPFMLRLALRHRRVSKHARIGASALRRLRANGLERDLYTPAPILAQTLTARHPGAKPGSSVISACGVDERSLDSYFRDCVAIAFKLHEVRCLLGPALFAGVISRLVIKAQN
jgi:hypothetical protein